MEYTYIYGLVAAKDPLEKRYVRYVGKADEPSERLKRHVTEAKKPKTNFRKSAWVLANSPKILILEKCGMLKWEYRERYWIKHLHEMFGLLNIKPGGNGKTAGFYVSELTRQRMRKSRKGRVITKATRQKMSQSLKAFYLNGGINPQLGKKWSKEARKKFSEARLALGFRHSMESRKKMSKSRMGYKPSKEAVEKMRKTMTGRKLAEEHRKNISEAGKGRKHSIESRQKISDSHKGLKPTIKTRLKMSISAKKRWSSQHA